MFQRTPVGDLGDLGRQQIQGDNEVTLSGSQPPRDLLRDHERTELQGRGARQPGSLQGQDILRQIGQQQAHAATGPGAQAGKGDSQGLCLGYELAIGGELGTGEVDFKSESTRRIWSRYESLERGELERLVSGLRLENEKILAG